MAILNELRIGATWDTAKLSFFVPDTDVIHEMVASGSNSAAMGGIGGAAVVELHSALPQSSSDSVVLGGLQQVASVLRNDAHFQGPWREHSAQAAVNDCWEGAQSVAWGLRPTMSFRGVNVYE